jgi:serine/threonine-protein kinase
MTSVAEGTGAVALAAGAGDPASDGDALEELGAAAADASEAVSLRGHPASNARVNKRAWKPTARPRLGGIMAWRDKEPVVHRSCCSASRRAVQRRVCSFVVTGENRVGEVLASKYRLEELLGSGGMGHVYRAVNEHIGRAVAIKVLRSEHAQNGQVVERFLREARAANLVRHPNVVDVLDIGKEDGGAPFIVQELLDGEDLAHFVERRGGKLPLEEVCDLLLPVIEAVAEAHARGVVHRDIKPENVFLVKAPRGPIPKLLDFGISKVRAPDLRATEVGMMMGTPAYMAPEQVQGARDADPRSDVWALGVMMFELIAGRMPFDVQDAPALFVAIATRDAPTLLEVRAEVTPAVSRVVERCLRRRPDERYPSAAELGRDLRHVMDGTDLEPTGRRSIPPQMRALVPDLEIPEVRVPVIAMPAPPLAMAANASGYVGSAPDYVVDPKGATLAGTGFAEAPELGMPAAALPLHRQESQAPRGRLAVGASLPGVMLAPGPSAIKRPGSYEAWGVRPAKERADLTPIVGLGVVGLVAILGTGLLMQLVHRPEGWAIAQFVFGPAQGGAALAVHGGLGLVSIAIGLTYCWRGVRHWRGDLAGGPPSAIVNAVIAAGAFFCAIEIVSAIS